MRLGIILVHGYTGSPFNLKPLEDALCAYWGKDSVKNLSLPGHEVEGSPGFDLEIFTNSINNSIQEFTNQNRKIIIIGHSTGGSLALSTLNRFSVQPDLLILISVPKRIDGAYCARWDIHRTDKKEIPFIDVAMMVNAINKAGSLCFNQQFPVVILHGEEDSLVPWTEAQAWKEDSLVGARVITVPGSDHDIFSSENNLWAIDIIRRAIQDNIHETNCHETMGNLLQIEPGLKDFLDVSPHSKYHLCNCPSTKKVIHKNPDLLDVPLNEPIIANIEITTYCNLHCKFCARTRLAKQNKHMSLSRFKDILALLPNTYKIVIVGLGEPLMHPQLIEFVSYAKSLKRNVGLVTNAMLLSTEISVKLLEAGLDSIAFSLDGFDDNISTLVRKGTNFAKVINNIKNFVEKSNDFPKISKAVFSAVSTDTIEHLPDLIDQVSSLGVDVLMLSDINFKTNQKYTLWKNMNEHLEETIKKAITYAFSQRLPVLTVHGLEEFGLAHRYHDFLMIPPNQLYQRSLQHTWCYSPWQTIPVDVEGNVTLCDCQPEVVLGNLFRDPFTNIWNGDSFREHRNAMRHSNPPEACSICPRF